jgi:hypothetical protein
MKCTKIVLALIIVSIGSSAARCLHQHSAGQRVGAKFSFDRDGGAAAYLQKLQQDRPQVMQQVLQRTARALPGEAGRSAAAAVTRKGQLVGASSASASNQAQAAVQVLAKHLDQDQGLVSSNGCIHPANVPQGQYLIHESGAECQACVAAATAAAGRQHSCAYLS